jgi:hypothetical protein
LTAAGDADPPQLDDSWRHARELGLKFETATFERRNGFSMTSVLEREFVLGDFEERHMG